MHPYDGFHKAFMFEYRSSSARAGVARAGGQSALVGNLETGSVASCTTRISPNVRPFVLGPASLLTCGVIGIVVCRLLQQKIKYLFKNISIFV